MSNDRPWLDNYPPGVPADIDITQYRSIVDVLEESFEKYRDRPAFTSFGKTVTYGEIDELSNQFAGYLSGELKLAKGDRIAIMLLNVIQYPVALFAALRLGLVVVNTNPLYTPRELEHQLKDSGAKALIVLDNFAATAQEALEHVPVPHVITTGIGDLLGVKGAVINFVLKHVKKMVPEFRIDGAVRFGDALSRGGRHETTSPDVSREDIAFLQYTGGTTGVAKGAMLTHGNMVANMLQAGAWFGKQIRPGEETIITALPLYHIFALTCNCFIFLRFGGRSVLITNPRDMPGFVKELSKVRFTAITGVNTLFNGLVHTEGFDKLDFSSLRMSFGGGMAVQRVVAEKWQAITGCPLIEGYGMTESSPVATINPMIEGASFSGSIGMPVPSTDISIQDDDGKHLAIGEIGEICIHGPQVMKGYWNQPGETAKAISSDGWLRTGDIGRIDEKGLVYIVDRKKDMILVSGFNVYPNEIEDIVVRCPGVLECAAVGVPDEHSGEVVKLFVVRKDPSLTEETIKAWCREYLTGYKRPKLIEFRDSLPKSNVGKILRRELRDEEKKKAG
ncbi:long-chain-fatty-acid--CoA ligase [Pinirhizobacter soli]|uniref:long-chain-fatty-acid--CoA ligase n=1 Tax=Pinirhizobacter soli TaxID=2786953 RepID=UPI00202A84EC|nr:long-chain-fatty-acid--CoA ligase [Pinirhizobacter soli]